jgi:DNA ligase-1
VESRSKKGTENCGVDLDRTNANFAHEKARTLTSALELVLGGCTKKPIGVSGSAVSKALTVTQGLSRNQLSKAYRKYGDLGDVAASFFQKRNSFFVSTSSSKRSRRLSILQVSRELVRLSETDGSNAKISIVQGLLQKCESRTEIRMIVRLLIANMRIGANMKTVLTALAMVVHTVYTQDSSSTKEDYVFRTDSYLPGVKDVISMVQKTHDLCPDLHRIIFSLLEGGLEKMKADCTIEVLCAIRPMLAHAIHGIDEIADAMSSNNNKNKEMIMEWKYVSTKTLSEQINSSFPSPN